jgi:hypothetical protein
VLHGDKPNVRIDPFYDPDHDTTTHTDSSRVLTDKDYGEKESGRPPDKEPDFIYITKDKDEDSPQLTYGEKAYLIEGSSTERNDDVLVPADEVYVALNNNNEDPTLNSDGNHILIKGLTHDNLQGITFLRREDDGTKNRIQVVEAIENRRNGNKDLSEFIIKYNRDQVEDIMSYNDIMNHVHRDRLKDGGHI